jgi:hypothetical protein
VTTSVLLPSPPLPPVAYVPLADALERRGWAASVASPPAAPAGPSPVLTAYASFVQERRPDVVVAHSNAGRYAVAVAAGAPVVYVDAALPPEEGQAPLAPEGLLSRLASMVGRDGLLPPWTHWWPDDDLATVLPDPDVLAGIRAVEGRLPLAYFQARLGAPPGWTRSRQAYLAYGDTYADEVAVARRLGWPVAVVPGAGHLHHVVDPDGAGDAVVALAAEVGVSQ